MFYVIVDNIIAGALELFNFFKLNGHKHFYFIKTVMWISKTKINL